MQAPQNPWMLVLEVVLAVLLPLVGLIIAIVLLATKRTRDGLIVFAATIAGGAGALALYA
jgi:hypothetical protein